MIYPMASEFSVELGELLRERVEPKAVDAGTGEEIL